MANKRKRGILCYGKQPRRGQHPLADEISMFFPNSNEIDYSQEPLPAPPKIPTSQKVATMPAEPEDEKVGMLMDLSGMGRSDAVRYLKVCLVLL